MFWAIAGCVYGVSVLATSIISIVQPLDYRHKIKKEGYEYLKGQGIKAFNITFPDIGYNLLGIFTPVLNTFCSFYVPYSMLEDYEKDYANFKEKLIENGIIKKSEKRLAYEEDYILKQEKFKKARSYFLEGKMGNFDELDNVSKIEMLKQERENVYNAEEPKEASNAYEKLTPEEKIEFLNTLREEVLNNYNIEYPPKQNKKLLRRK